MKTGVLLLTVLITAMLMAYTAVATPNPLPGAIALTPTMTATATASPTTTPTPAQPPFEATMSVVPGRQVLAVGEELLVTIDIDVVPGCVFPVYELDLQQFGGNAPLFAYLDPPTALIGPGVAMPTTYRLLAVRPGTITFYGQAYGERNCNDFWNWTYVSGDSTAVQVQGNGIGALLPLVITP